MGPSTALVFEQKCALEDTIRSWGIHNLLGVEANMRVIQLHASLILHFLTGSTMNCVPPLKVHSTVRRVQRRGAATPWHQVLPDWLLLRQLSWVRSMVQHNGVMSAASNTNLLLLTLAFAG